MRSGRRRRPVRAVCVGLSGLLTLSAEFVNKATGRGTPLGEIVTCYVGPDCQDVMTEVDAVIDLGIADPHQLVVGGWSGSGYLTNLTIMRATASRLDSGAGISNWVSYQETSDCRATFDRYLVRFCERLGPSESFLARTRT